MLKISLTVLSVLCWCWQDPLPPAPPPHPPVLSLIGRICVHVLCWSGRTSSTPHCSVWLAGYMYLYWVYCVDIGRTHSAPQCSMWLAGYMYNVLSALCWFGRTPSTPQCSAWPQRCLSSWCRTGRQGRSGWWTSLPPGVVRVDSWPLSGGSSPRSDTYGMIPHTKECIVSSFHNFIVHIYLSTYMMYLLIFVMFAVLEVSISHTKKGFCTFNGSCKWH